MEKFIISGNFGDKVDSSSMIKKLLSDQKAIIIVARGEDAAILSAYNPEFEKILKDKGRVIYSLLKDAEKDPQGTLGIGALQIQITEEEDAFIFENKLILSGITTFTEWEKSRSKI